MPTVVPAWISSTNLLNNGQFIEAKNLGWQTFGSKALGGQRKYLTLITISTISLQFYQLFLSQRVLLKVPAGIKMAAGSRLGPTGIDGKSSVK